MEKPTLSDTTGIDLETIQRQIQDYGAFSPLHWLLQSGHIAFASYESWRQGEVTTLDDLLTVGSDSLPTLIENALAQTQALGLEPEPQLFYSWASSNNQKPLRTSENRELAQWLGQRWRRPQELPQMDLFMDSGTAVAENELIDSLCHRHWEEAEKAYHRFSENSPSHSNLVHYEGLLIYGKHMSSSEPVSQKLISEELLALQNEITPLANELLKHQARDYLSFAWQRLAKFLPGETFDPATPDIHLSFAMAQLPDWPAVIAAIKLVPDFAQHPVLVMRLAQAYWHSSEPELAILLCCKLIELTETAESELDGVSNERFVLLWNNFWEHNLPIELFPAFVLIEEPQLIHQLKKLPTAQPQHPAFAAVKQLLQSRGDNDRQVHDRQQLQDISPELLKLFLRKI